MYINSLKELILQESEHYIIINKPAFISTLADRNSSVNILALATDYCETAQVCHRLDKETSGALVIAKTPEAYRNMAMQLEARTVGKEYHAIVDGLLEAENMEVDLPLYTNSNAKVRVSHKRGKEAKTTFSTIEALKKHTLVACFPESGRMHQIRVHLASQGFPIAGDENYEGSPILLSSVKRKFNLKQGKEEQPLMKRFALHAARITFKDMDEKEISVEAPYPKDFAVALKQLRKNS